MESGIPASVVGGTSVVVGTDSGKRILRRVGMYMSVLTIDTRDSQSPAPETVEVVRVFKSQQLRIWLNSFINTEGGTCTISGAVVKDSCDNCDIFRTPSAECFACGRSPKRTIALPSGYGDGIYPVFTVRRGLGIHGAFVVFDQALTDRLWDEWPQERLTIELSVESLADTNDLALWYLGPIRGGGDLLIGEAGQPSKSCVTVLRDENLQTTVDVFIWLDDRVESHGEFKPVAALCLSSDMSAEFKALAQLMPYSWDQIDQLTKESLVFGSMVSQIEGCANLNRLLSWYLSPDDVRNIDPTVNVDDFEEFEEQDESTRWQVWAALNGVGDARAELDDALTQLADPDEFRLFVAFHALEMCEYQPGVEMLDQLTTEGAEHPMAVMLKLQCLANLGRLTEAEAVALRVEEEAVRSAVLAIAAWEAGEMDAVKAHYEDFQRFNGRVDMPDVAFSLAALLSRLGRRTNDATAIRRAIADLSRVDHPKRDLLLGWLNEDLTELESLQFTKSQ